jgi:2'-5' RNA ligase
MRCFIAADIGGAARGTLGRIVEELRPRCPGARWVNPGQIHLTLEFLGELDPGDAARVGEALAEMRDEGPIEAEIRGLGAFPVPSAARVLWAGVHAKGGRIERLAARARGITARLGLGGRDARPFVAHLTLARFRNPCDPGRLEVGAESRDTVEGRCLIDRIVLMESLLSRAGAEYRIVREVGLEGPCSP